MAPTHIVSRKAGADDRFAAVRTIDVGLRLICTSPVSADAIIERLTKRLYGSPIIRNDARGEVVEEIVAMALEPEWQGCGGDWASCDLVRPADGKRIQVKQSAAKQTWHKADARPPRPCFSIREKTGRWESGDQWVEERGRNAEIFVFAWHPVTDASADHRDPHQWEFFVVPEHSLPAQDTMSLSRIRQMTEPVRFEALATAVRSVSEQLP
jgi:hypothetical protein